MRVLLDEQLPLDLSLELRGHAVDTVVSRGWAGIKNGELLDRIRDQYDTSFSTAGQLRLRACACQPG